MVGFTRLPLACLMMVLLISAVSADGVHSRRAAMAVENLLLAEDLCGVELTFLARNLIMRDCRQSPRPFSEDRAVLANLWRETFACNPAFAGENCFAARWQMCQRAYEEYGPNGIRTKGLIKAIIKK